MLPSWNSSEKSRKCSLAHTVIRNSPPQMTHLGSVQYSPIPKWHANGLATTMWWKDEWVKVSQRGRVKLVLLKVFGIIKTPCLSCVPNHSKDMDFPGRGTHNWNPTRHKSSGVRQAPFLCTGPGLWQQQCPLTKWVQLRSTWLWTQL